jgi:Right handed beta helix region
MRIPSSPAPAPQDRGRHAQPGTGPASARLSRLRSEMRVHRWQIAGTLAVCVVATLIGLFGPAWLGSRNANFTGPRTAAAGPAAPPVRVCGNKAVLGGGPAAPPAGAVMVPAGNDARIEWGRPQTTYWFAPGTHTLGPGMYTQIIPGRGSTFVGAPGAILDGRHVNYYAFGGYAPNVTISHLTVQNFGVTGGNNNQGVVNHNSATGWRVEHSTVAGNAGAGLMVGSGNTLAWDCLLDNQQYGFNAYAPGPSGPANIVITHDEIAGNDTYNWELRQPGCGCTGGGKFWEVTGAVVSDNWVHGNHSVGLWADSDNRGFAFTGNYIASNYGSGLIYEISYNALIKDNTFLRNGLGAGPKNPGFPTGAIYVSESGSDSRVPGKYGTTFAITGNTFTDNWGGVILWENSNRFCASPANTSSGICTLVNKAVTLKTCTAARISHAPYYSDCRWKTQNVAIDHNVFNFDPAKMGSACTAEKDCGYQGVFSEYGTYPAWSPYKKDVVSQAITFHQNNRFFANTYNGPWLFMAFQQSETVSWGAWQSAPYHQDAGSTMDSVAP